MPRGPERLPRTDDAPSLAPRLQPIGRPTVRTLAEAVYLQLRHQIINLELPPGERLSEARLAKAFGVSRSPVKEALRRLADEGLVRIRPQYGSFVAPISLAQALEFLEIRMLLEPHAARRAAVNLSDDELEHLQHVFDQIEAYPPSTAEHAAAVWRADDELHRLIAQGCGNREILRILTSNHDRINRIRRATARYSHRLPSSLSEMKTILAALKGRDPDGASEAMRLHLANLQAAVQQLPAEA